MIQFLRSRLRLGYWLSIVTVTGLPMLCGQSPSLPDNAALLSPESWSLHAQATTVSQKHSAFVAPYDGSNSLERTEPWRTTETITIYFGRRLWTGGELYINPEASGGKGLSGTVGVAGFPNGEATRVGNPTLTPYVARAFLRHTFALNSQREPIAADLNQVAGFRPPSNVVLTVGKLSAGDIFDGNTYSHDPRTQFENWSLMTNGAWDYPADTRGYTYGVAVEFNHGSTSARAGSLAEPTEANGADFDHKIYRANGNVLEVERRYANGNRKGAARLLVFENSARMGSYADALMVPRGTTPDLTFSRTYRSKRGVGLNVEQQITEDFGVFGRAGWNDGREETWAFTEIDNTVSVGVAVQGQSWGRKDDTWAIAGVSNGLSADHRAYLAAGGYGFIVGDGRLRYTRENIVETYYSVRLGRAISLTGDMQLVQNPAYNRDRGPVIVTGFRIHVQQ